MIINLISQFLGAILFGAGVTGGIVTTIGLGLGYEFESYSFLKKVGIGIVVWAVALILMMIGSVLLYG